MEAGAPREREYSRTTVWSIAKGTSIGSILDFTMARFRLSNSSTRFIRTIVGLALVWAIPAVADIIQTTDGSRLQGKILKVDAGVIEIETAFAGVVKVKQTSVEWFGTDTPVNVQFQDGNTVEGIVAGTSGSITVTSDSASATGAVGSVTAAWLPGEDSPEVRQIKASARRWKFEASLDVLGKSGNSDSMASSVGFRAMLAGPRDKLELYAAFARAEQDGTTTVDQAKAGIDFSSNFSDRTSWYVREEIGTDKIQGLDYASNTAAGLGYDWIKSAKQTLTVRGGLAHRYEAYSNGVTTKVNAPALDLAIIHDYTAANWRIGNRLTFLPTIEDFGVFRVQHESFFEVPLAVGRWKVRVGLANDYNSEPLPGKTELDTTYFTKFVLGWE